MGLKHRSKKGSKKRSNKKASKKRRASKKKHAAATAAAARRVALASTASTASTKFNEFRAGADDEGMEQPRQLLFLSFLLVPLCYFALLREEDMGGVMDGEKVVSNIGHACGMMGFAFLIYVCLQLRDTIMVRPHPLLWRFVHGVMVLYVFIICGLLVQSVGDARAFLNYFLEEVREEDHGDQWDMKHCQITAETLYRQVTSWWFASHFFGWFGKMLMLRDWRVCFLQSLVFEFIELSLQFLIGDFKECWWDSVLLDFGTANLAGMVLGWMALKLCNSRLYDWGGRPDSVQSDGEGAIELALRSHNPLTYFRWTTPDTQWAVFSDLSRMTMYIAAVFMPIQLELNIFLLMYTMWIPPSLLIVRLRITFLLLLALPAFMEFYEFAVNPKCKRLGQNTWVAFAMTFIEMLICIKFGRASGQFNFVPPPEIYIPWVIAAICWLTWFLGHFFIFDVPSWVAANKGQKNVVIPTHVRVLDVIFYVSFLPFLTLMRLWAF